MNERIIELAQQADLLGECSPSAPSSERYFGYITEKQIEEFATLIVLECAKLTLDYKNDQHYAGWIEYRDEIKKHFGIENDRTAI